MSTDLETTEKKPRGLRAWAETDDAQREIAAAVGDIMPADQFLAHMLVAFQDEKVRACSDQSKYRALKECAALGLVPTLGQVSLIPYKTELKAMPEWEGYKALMERHPDVLEVIGVLVHLSDVFSMQEGQVHHAYDPFNEARTIMSSKDLRGGYLKIIYRDGRPPKYHMVRRSTIEQAEGCAQTTKVWKTWYYEMALKTLYRNAYARRAVPIDPMVNTRLERAVNVDNLNLGNDPMRIQSEASDDHVDQARRQREALDRLSEPDPTTGEAPSFNPPTPEEQTAAEGSQVNPAVENADGVDDPPDPPEPTSEEEEVHIGKKIEKATKITEVNEAVELAGDGENPWLGRDAVERLKKKAEQQRLLIRSKRGPNAKNKPVE